MSNANYFVDVTVCHSLAFLCDNFLVELVITFISSPIIELFVAFGSELKYTPLNGVGFNTGISQMQNNSCEHMENYTGYHELFILK